MPIKRKIRLGKHYDVDAHEFLNDLTRDRSTWVDVPHYPDSITSRRMFRLADFIACEPERWKTIRMAYDHPDWSMAQIAAERRISPATICRHLQPINLALPDDYPDDDF